MLLCALAWRPEPDSPTASADQRRALMFTGIIEEMGTVLEARGGRLRIQTRVIAEDTRLGDSIAINGVDLTVSRLDGGVMAFDVMPETFRRSNLGELSEGDPVNLERSVRPTDRLSGHIVRGVVEGTGMLESTEPEGDAVIVTYRAPAELLEYVVVKGPICIDGASLTVIARSADSFSVSLVKYTQEHTNHLRKQPGDSVNLETDIVARYVGALLEARGAVPPRRDE
jgi:riboflavin synthase